MNARRCVCGDVPGPDTGPIASSRAAVSSNRGGGLARKATSWSADSP